MSQQVIVMHALFVWAVAIFILYYKGARYLIMKIGEKLIEITPLSRLTVSIILLVVVTLLLWVGGYVGEFLMSPIFFLYEFMKEALSQLK